MGLVRMDVEIDFLYQYQSTQIETGWKQSEKETAYQKEAGLGIS